MTNGLLKSSKRKQKLYEKFLRKRTYKNETRYKGLKKYLKVQKNNRRKIITTI